MATMSSPIPDSLWEWAQKRVTEGGYTGPGDYVSDLIRQDRRRHDKLAALQEAIRIGVESGDAGEMDIESIKREARQGYAKPDAPGPRE